MSLTPEHRRWLEDHAVDVTLAESLGVCSVAKVADLPDEWRKGLGRHTPGILLPWTAHDGRVHPQLHPDKPQKDQRGRPKKYVFQKDSPPVLWQVRPNPRATKILIVEGSKQCLVAATYAPSDFEVYGIAGCWGWSKDGIPIPDLEIVFGREVWCLFDADAASNMDVWDATERFTAVLKGEGALKVSWVRMPLTVEIDPDTEERRKVTTGLDDVLKERPAERRASWLQRQIEMAKPKAADQRPRRQPRRVAMDPTRPRLKVNDETLTVVENIELHLKDRHDGKDLFCHGGVLSLLDDGCMHPLTIEGFADLLVRTMQPVAELPNGDIEPRLPDKLTMGMVHVARARNFTPLEAITSLPFVRHDGTICIDPGYDPPMATYLEDSEDLQRVKVPEHPCAEDIRDAATLLLDDWLGDFAFPDQASRANALAYVLTPFIRGLVPVAPLAVIDGLQMGVGKNLLANVIAIVTTGEPVDPKPYHADDDDENRKTLLGCFRAGDQHMAWDEAHVIQGSNLARALTAITYSDRILGVSTVARFPNRMTWAALGNQVQVRGDMSRRVYWIELHPSGANPHQRSQEEFRHPDLEGWTREHRAELLSACLTLIRAWFDAGRPAQPAHFASFERWERMLRGILTVAGVRGFLDNAKEKASEGDLVAQWWYAHLSWVHENLDQPFIAADVKRKAQEDLSDYHAPLNLDDTSDKSYAKKLGEAYRSVKDRWFEGYKLVRAGKDRRGVAKWLVITEDEARAAGQLPLPPVPASSAGTAGTSYPMCVDNTSLQSVQSIKGEELPPQTPHSLHPPGDGEVIFDLETASATELYSYEHGSYVRLGGYADPAQPEQVTLTTDWKGLSAKLRAANVVSGHNVLGFDLQALQHHHGLPLQPLVAEDRVFDTLLAARHIDPPMAKEKGVDAQRRYDLDTLGKKYFGEEAGKTDDLKRLAKKFGGFDQIPVEDEEYRRYLIGDVTLNARLYQRLREELAKQGPRSQDYLMREHRVAAIAAQISLNGFRVDTDLLTERLDHNERIRRAALNRLHERYGLPLADEKGRAYKSPLSTTAGRKALCAALVQAGVPEGAWWTTDKTDDIALSVTAFKNLALQYMDKPAVRDICRMVVMVVGLRSVYSTVENCLVGDRVHPSVSMKQSTGRWSLTRPGLTVFGKRGGRYHEREVFLAEPGHVVIACDLSQVDMRAVAGLSGDRNYIDLFHSEIDPHTQVALQLFGTADRREEAKTISHGWNYGRGIKAISNGNEIDPKLVIKFDAQMRERFPRLVEWQNEVREWAGSGDLLDNGFGRKMRPDPARAHTQGPALMGQGAARDIMMEGLLRLPAEVLPMLRAQVHDEIVLSVPAADAADIQQVVIDALSFQWEAPSGETVPIVADGGPTDRVSWGAVYEK